MRIYALPEETGLPFILDVDKELTKDKEAMAHVACMLDDIKALVEKAKKVLKKVLAVESSEYHKIVTDFMTFHRDYLGIEIAAELFPGKCPASITLEEMVDYLKLDCFGSLFYQETGQQVFCLDFSFNPDFTDELLVVYFDLKKEIIGIIHENGSCSC